MSDAGAAATGRRLPGVAALRREGPGLVLMIGVAVGAELLAGVTGLSSLVIAVGAAALAANVVGVPDWARPGLDRHKLALETGIVLLGAGLTVGQLASAGPRVVALAVLGVVVGVVSVELLCRIAGVRERAGALVASGAGVCGVSAVVAVAGGIDADEADVAYAVGTVLLFDAITLVAFPAVGAALGLDGQTFGVWAGVSMFSTGPVAAAGFAHSEVAGRWATVTKLVRNATVGLVVVAYSVRYARRASVEARDGAASGSGSEDDGGAADAEVAADADGTGPGDDPDATDASTGAGPARPSLGTVWTRFPKFVVGFLAVALLANTVLPGAAAPADRAADALFALAFAGLGFDIELDAVRDAGLAPVAAVGVHLLAWSALALVIVAVVL